MYALGGKKLTFRGMEYNNRICGTFAAGCKNCPLKEKCCNKNGLKTISHTMDKPYYDRAYRLLNTRKGKQKTVRRAATAEPVRGTLLITGDLKKFTRKETIWPTNRY
jgi:adenine-specific DNA glycosylase